LEREEFLFAVIHYLWFVLTKLRKSLYKNLAKPFFIGKEVVFVPSCHSTNDIASELLKNDVAHEGTIVITDKQTDGRGQLGNRWESQQEMNLTFSIILKPSLLAIKDHFMLNVISSLAICDFIAKFLPNKVKVKWPNDVYVGDEKIAGILTSNTVRSSQIESTVIGVGLNVNQVEFEVDNATSLKLATGQHFSLGECLESLVLAFEKRYFQLFRNNAYHQLIEDYESNLYWNRELHTFSRKGHLFSGTIQGINPIGQLHVETDEGDEFFNFKEIAFIR